MDPIELKLGESYEPLCCIQHNIGDRKLVASCGTKIIIMDTREGVAVDKMINIEESRYMRLMMTVVLDLLCLNCVCVCVCGVCV